MGSFSTSDDSSCNTFIVSSLTNITRNIYFSSECGASNSSSKAILLKLVIMSSNEILFPLSLKLGTKIS